MMLFVSTNKETNIHNHARQKFHGLCKKGSKGSYMCVYSQEETETARRHANKNVDENTDAWKSFVQQMNMQKPTRKVSCMIE